MKTIHDSDPEFSMTYTHCGISVTVSGKIESQDYLSIADSDPDNAERLGRISKLALQQVATRAAAQLTQFHYEFEQSLATSQSSDLQSYPLSSHSIDENQNINTPAVKETEK